MLYFFAANLENHFDKIKTAMNGQDAVNMVKEMDKGYYTAIILDIDMPVMNGMDACVLIKKYLDEEGESEEEKKQIGVASRRPFVYALTAEIDEEVIKKIRRSGFKTICKS